MTTRSELHAKFRKRFFHEVRGKIPTARPFGAIPTTVCHTQSSINRAIMSNRSKRIPVTLPTIPKPED